MNGLCFVFLFLFLAGDTIFTPNNINAFEEVTDQLIITRTNILMTLEKRNTGHAGPVCTRDQFESPRGWPFVSCVTQNCFVVWQTSVHIIRVLASLYDINVLYKVLLCKLQFVVQEKQTSLSMFQSSLEVNLITRLGLLHVHL